MVSIKTVRKTRGGAKSKSTRNPLEIHSKSTQNPLKIHFRLLMVNPWWWWYSLIMSVWVMIWMTRVVWIQLMNVKHVSKRTKKQGYRYGPSWICRNSTSVFASFSFLDLLIWPFCICDAYHRFFWTIAGFLAKLC